MKINMKQKGGLWEHLHLENCRGQKVKVEDIDINRQNEKISEGKKIVQGILGFNELIKDFFRLVLQKWNIEDHKNKDIMKLVNPSIFDFFAGKTKL